MNKNVCIDFIMAVAFDRKINFSAPGRFCMKRCIVVANEKRLLMVQQAFSTVSVTAQR